MCKCYDGRAYAIWANMRMVINILLYFRPYFPYLLTCIYFSVTSVVELKEDVKRTRQKKTSKEDVERRRCKKTSKGIKKHCKASDRRASQRIVRHRKASKCIERHQKASKNIKRYQNASKGIKTHRKASKGIERH